MGAQYVVEFDWRADDGPRLVGPFPSRDAAQAWLDTIHVDFDGQVRPIASPARAASGEGDR